MSLVYLPPVSILLFIIIVTADAFISTPQQIHLWVSIKSLEPEPTCIKKSQNKGKESDVVNMKINEELA